MMQYPIFDITPVDDENTNSYKFTSYNHANVFIERGYKMIIISECYNSSFTFEAGSNVNIYTMCDNEDCFVVMEKFPHNFISMDNANKITLTDKKVTIEKMIVR